ncbi:MAG: hypothetical protein ABJA75_04390 [Bradyrhizobium sp.]
MSGETNTENSHEPSSAQTGDTTFSRRNMLLGTSTLVAAAAMTSGALAQAQRFAN